jgi:hypothetical protein
MTQAQQIINEETARYAQILGLDRDAAFARLAHLLVTGMSVHQFDEADLTDGSGEKQIDTFTIVQHSGESASVYLIQSTTSPSFPSNKLHRMGRGMDWVFLEPSDRVKRLSNARLKDRILAFRQLRSEIGASDIHVVASFVSLGDTTDLPKEYREDSEAIRSRFDDDTYGSFTLQSLGARELLDKLSSLEKRGRRKNARLRIDYDVHRGSLIKHRTSDMRGAVLTVHGTDIANLVNSDPTDSVFDMNVRRFLGVRGAVNSSILSTCSDTGSSGLFWFLNNGITIVCEKADLDPEPKDAHVSLENLQIVNGCQTAKSLALAQRKGNLPDDVRVLVRVYETQSVDVVRRIVLSTNSQNKITSRDLHSNEPEQEAIERLFRSRGYFYERKPRQYDTDPSVNVDRVITNELVGQCYAAIRLKRPADARRRKYKIWDDLYSTIFSPRTPIEAMLLPVLVHRRTTLVLRSMGLRGTELRAKLAKTAAFHVSRIAAQLWLGRDYDATDPKTLSKRVEQIENDPTVVDECIQQALSILEKLVGSRTEFRSDIDVAMKSSDLEDAISKYLYGRVRSQPESSGGRISEVASHTAGSSAKEGPQPTPVAPTGLQPSTLTALQTLTRRQEKILRLRYGVADGRRRTLAELGEMLGISRERVRQIEMQALKKLRKLHIADPVFER